MHTLDLGKKKVCVSVYYFRLYISFGVPLTFHWDKFLLCINQLQEFTKEKPERVGCLERTTDYLPELVRQMWLELDNSVAHFFFSCNAKSKASLRAANTVGGTTVSSRVCSAFFFLSLPGNSMKLVYLVLGVVALLLLGGPDSVLSSSSGNLHTFVGCAVREFTFVVKKPGCRGLRITTDACWGRCETWEVSGPRGLGGSVLRDSSLISKFHDGGEAVTSALPCPVLWALKSRPHDYLASSIWSETYDDAPSQRAVEVVISVVLCVWEPALGDQVLLFTHCKDHKQGVKGEWLQSQRQAMQSWK